ncbi:MAG: DUF5674 family protein [Candidatus Cryptobacteroides sp.]
MLEKPITGDELKDLSSHFYGDMIKCVVDITRERIAMDAEFQSDLESMLIREGSSQDDLWGINLYPEVDGEDFIEFDSLINIRPRIGNRSRDVEDEDVRKRIIEIVGKYVVRV